MHRRLIYVVISYIYGPLKATIFMKRILRFFPLRNDLCHIHIYDVITSVYNYWMRDFAYMVFNSIMPVKSERFNTKIYIFERYSTLCTSHINMNTSLFMYNRAVLKPVLQKK